MGGMGSGIACGGVDLGATTTATTTTTTTTTTTAIEVGSRHS